MEPVKCRRCGRDIPADARYCTYCGFPTTLQTGIPAPQQSPIQDEIRQLRELVNQINLRLDALENRQLPAEEIPPLPEEIPPEAVARLPETEVAPEVTPEPAAGMAQTEQPVISPVEPAETMGIPAKVSPVIKEPKVKGAGEWEQILGGNWLARIGILALIIGMGFFLKFAFDRDWIGPSARVVLGVVVGLALLGLGYYWRKRYPIMNQVLSGGGIAILYLSIFASFATYHLISIYPAVLLLLITSVLSAVLAMRYESMALAIIGIFGAFFAPFILGAFSDRGAAGSSSQAVPLLVYIIAVDIGVLVLSRFRNWRWFTLLALACSLITYGFWYLEFHEQAGIATAEIGITIIYLIFVGATSLFHIIRRRIPQIFDYILVLLAAGSYFGISLSVMWGQFRGWMGGFILILAIFYGAISYFAYKRNPEHTGLSKLSLAIALIFLTAAVPVQFRNDFIKTIVWAVEGTVIMWLAFRKNIRALRFFSYIIFMIVAVWLLSFDTWLGRATYRPIFNERFLAFVISIALTWFSAFLLWKNRKDVQGLGYPEFIFTADILTLWIIGVEAYNYSQQSITTASGPSMLVLLVLSAATVMNYLFWRRKYIIIDNILSIVNAVALIIFSVFIWGDFRAWMGTAYFLPAIFYGILTYFSIKREGNGVKLSSFSLFIAMIFLTVAIPVQFRDHAPTTIAWAVEMAALVWLSFKLKLPYMRYFSYIVFVTMMWRMLIFDTTISRENFTPVLNARFLAYIFGIAGTYLSAYLLWRNREKLIEWRFIAPFLLIIVNFLTIWLISFEVWDTYSVAIGSASQAGRVGLSNAQNLSLTAVWAIYAVAGLVVGIRKHWRYVRIGALALLVIPIGKVFVYDVFKLEMGYRIGAFVGLGLLLLASAYLYQRYSKIIKGVFTER